MDSLIKNFETIIELKMIYLYIKLFYECFQIKSVITHC